jgi:hypothetical protein
VRVRQSSDELDEAVQISSREIGIAEEKQLDQDAVGCAHRERYDLLDFLRWGLSSAARVSARMHTR